MPRNLKFHPSFLTSSVLKCAFGTVETYDTSQMGVHQFSNPKFKKSKVLRFCRAYDDAQVTMIGFFSLGKHSILQTASTLVLGCILLPTENLKFHDVMAHVKFYTC